MTSQADQNPTHENKISTHFGPSFERYVVQLEALNLYKVNTTNSCKPMVRLLAQILRVQSHTHLLYFFFKFEFLDLFLNVGQYLLLYYKAISQNIFIFLLIKYRIFILKNVSQQLPLYYNISCQICKEEKIEKKLWICF